MVAGEQPDPGNDSRTRGSLVFRGVLSVLLAWHVAAVFLPPFTFATRSGTGAVSPFAAPLASVVRPYVDLLFLDHGYFFFAPNPGPSHLLRAQLEFDGDRPPLELTFPDLQRHWPRLLYHRHFMLAEQLHTDFVPPVPPPEVAEDPEQRASWQSARDHYLQRKKSFEEHLRQAYGARSVTLTRLEHTLLGPGEFRPGRRPLNGSDTYLDLSDSPETLPLVPPGGAP